MVLIRNKNTGAEKKVSERTAEIVINTNAFSKDWEIVRTPQPVPGEVIQFQEAKLAEQQTVEVVQFTKEPKPAKEILEPEPAKTFIEQQPPIQVVKTIPVCSLSCKKISDTIEYLKDEELRELLNDTRITARKLAEAELIKRGLK